MPAQWRHIRRIRQLHSYVDGTGLGSAGLHIYKIAGRLYLPGRHDETKAAGHWHSREVISYVYNGAGGTCIGFLYVPYVASKFVAPANTVLLSEWHNIDNSNTLITDVTSGMPSPLPQFHIFSPVGNGSEGDCEGGQGCASGTAAGGYDTGLFPDLPDGSNRVYWSPACAAGGFFLNRRKVSLITILARITCSPTATSSS